MNIDQLIAKLDESRSWLLKLLDGLKPDQWDAKPYPNVKSIRETLEHMVINDRVVPLMMRGEEPDYEKHAPKQGMSPESLLTLLKETQAQKLSSIRNQFKDRDLAEEIDTVYSGRQPIWAEIISVAYEEWYHIGQMSLVRQGTDSDWDYYAHFYSG